MVLFIQKLIDDSFMKHLKLKIEITIVAILFTGFILTLYFFDTSMDWNILKIISCIIISIWSLFLPQTITYFFFKIKNSDLKYSFKLGLSIGAKGFLSFLIMPYYGIKFYLINLNDITYNGELIL